ncbi:ArsR family transcriptional regulator [Acidianus sulfidivorans JP7]|uniref:Transcriptional regulator n=1 Tax=Acidianus sulfidivorans JP7 TaxID=619593 RepID=A0A2U9IQ90_9CREN|nr:winged helix-turn-helix domain-containing protein [Acidianus sulfidivorans]AWR98195.1 ArsR family transcriptional regulator [Acidianus sulfidivorans JP7]
MIVKLDEVLENKGWETRKKILEELLEKEMTAYELSKKLNMNYSTIKYHLELMERAGLISSKRENNKYLYRANNNVNFILNKI